MVTLNDIQTKRDDILRIAHCHGADNVRIFGSFVNGKATKDSDLDLLVRMKPGSSLIDRIALMQELEDLLHIKVDVVNEKSLNESIRESVYRHGVAI